MKHSEKNSKKLLGFIISLLFIFKENNTYAGISLPSNMSSIYSTKDPIASSIGGQIIWISQAILYAVAVILVIFAGVKYMWAAPESKAEFKKKFIYMTTGAVILFAAGSLVKLVGGLAMNNM